MAGLEDAHMNQEGSNRFQSEQLREVRRHYPGYQVLRQALKNVGGRVYDQMDIATPGGQRQPVLFEITSFYGK